MLNERWARIKGFGEEGRFAPLRTPDEQWWGCLVRDVRKGERSSCAVINNTWMKMRKIEGRGRCVRCCVAYTENR